MEFVALGVLGLAGSALASLPHESEVYGSYYGNDGVICIAAANFKPG